MADIKETIDSFASLGPNWNGYGEDAVTPEAIAAAKRLWVSPLSDGGIAFEMDGSEPGDCVLFDIAPDGRLSGFYICIDGIEHEWERETADALSPRNDAADTGGSGET